MTCYMVHGQPPCQALLEEELHQEEEEEEEEEWQQGEQEEEEEKEKEIALYSEPFLGFPLL